MKIAQLGYTRKIASRLWGIHTQVRSVQALEKILLLARIVQAPIEALLEACKSHS